MIPPIRKQWKRLSFKVISAAMLLNAMALADQKASNIAVLDLTPHKVDPGEVRVISEKLRVVIHEVSPFALLERQEMESILREQSFVLSDCTSDECFVRVGRLLTVEKMLAGHVGKVGSIYTISARLIDVESGKLDGSAWVEIDGTIGDVLTKGVLKVVEILFRSELDAGTGHSWFSMTQRPESGRTTVKRVVERTIETGIEMILISPDRFRMGSPSDEVGRFENEGPQRNVELSRFYVATCEVTQAQYAKFNPGHTSHVTGNDRPVDSVSWYDAVGFCNWQSEVEDLDKFYNETDLRLQGEYVRMDWDANGYRLPTEAEWEYACRGGKDGPFSSGDCLSSSTSNSDGREAYSLCEPTESPVASWDVGTGEANPYGLHDMHGDVWEWCNDWFGRKYYHDAATRDPHGPAEGSARVLRGGSWFNAVRYCRSAYRASCPPGKAGFTIGLRIVRSF